MSLQLYNVTLAAGELRRLPLVGNTLQFYTISGGFEFGLEPNALIPGRKDDVIMRAFREIYVRNPGASSIDMEIRYGEDVVFSRDNSIAVSSLPGVAFDGSQPVTISEWPADPIQGTFTPEVFDTLAQPGDVALPAAAATQLSAGRATKRETIIKLASDAAASIRVGGSTVAAASGVLIEPGESIVISGSAAVYGYSVAGETVHVLEVDKA